MTHLLSAKRPLRARADSSGRRRIIPSWKCWQNGPTLHAEGGWQRTCVHHTCRPLQRMDPWAWGDSIFVYEWKEVESLTCTTTGRRRTRMTGKVTGSYTGSWNKISEVTGLRRFYFGFYFQKKNWLYPVAISCRGMPRIEVMKSVIFPKMSLITGTCHIRTKMIRMADPPRRAMVSRRSGLR